MKMWKKWKALMVGMALAVVGLAAQQAQAAVGSPSILNIDVTIANSLSVAVDTASSNNSTMTYTWDSSANRVKVAMTTTTVTNDSGGLTERWNLKTNAQTLLNGAATVPWDLFRSTEPADIGAEQFSVQAQFLSAGTAAAGCPAAGDGTWTGASGQSKMLDTAAQIYGSVHPVSGNWFENAAPDVPANDRMLAYSGGTAGIRALCWKIIGPTTTANVSGVQNVQIIISAQNP